MGFIREQHGRLGNSEKRTTMIQLQEHSDFLLLKANIDCD